jgi:hypothetical protein
VRVAVVAEAELGNAVAEAAGHTAGERTAVGTTAGDEGARVGVGSGAGEGNRAPCMPGEDRHTDIHSASCWVAWNCWQASWSPVDAASSAGLAIGNQHSAYEATGDDPKTRTRLHLCCTSFADGVCG